MRTYTTLPPIERLLRYVKPIESGCWLWTGSISHNGYGNTFWLGGQAWATPHRASYRLLVGPIPDGLVLDHTCRNTICVNPDHLDPVTQQENLRRARANAPKSTHCRRGHEYAVPGNEYISPSGQRNCAECRRLSVRQHYANRSAA